MTSIGKGQQRPSSSGAGHRACVSMCSYNAPRVGVYGSYTMAQPGCYLGYKPNQGMYMCFVL